MIPNPGKSGKFRPLGIPSINDRFVQEVLRSIIVPMYEIQFSTLFHGFFSLIVGLVKGEII